MRKGMKRALALTLAAILAGGTAVIPASAQEAGEYYPETGSYAQAEENVAAVTGMKDTLRCESAEKNMNWSFFSENGGSVDWYGRMGFPEYAMNLYSMLGDGSVTVDDGNFSEDTAFTTNYSDGSSDVFNGFNVCELYDSPKMSDSEWSEMKENLASAYVAFKRDYPGVFWLNDSPEVIRVENSETLEGGEEIYSYQIYFVLKDHNNGFDIRDSKYQSAEAISEKIEQRNQSIQEVFSEMLNESLAGKITYFRENANTVAGSMGLGRDGYAQAVKLLCDEAGITSVIAGGECYVLLDSGWCAASDVREEDAAEPGTTDGQDGTDAGEDKTDGNAGDDKEEDKSDDKEDKSDSKWKIGGTAAAAPAFKSLFPMRASVGARDDSAKFVYSIGGTEITGTDADVFQALYDTLISPNTSNMVYGNTIGAMLPFKQGGNTASGAQYGITATKDGSPVSDLSFTLTCSAGLSGYPNASLNYPFTISCQGRDSNSAIVYDAKSGSIPEIKRKGVDIDTGGLSYNMYYNDETTFLQKGNPQISGVLTSDRDKVVAAAAALVGTRVRDEYTPEYSGTVSVELSLERNNTTDPSGAIASNYTLNTRVGDTLVSDNRIQRSGIKYTVIAQPVELGRVDVRLEQTEYEYTGNAIEPEVTVSVDGITLVEGEDYYVDYRNNVSATNDPAKTEVVITSRRSGTKFTWEGEKTVEFTILKASPEDASIDVVTRYGKEETVDLTDLMNTEGVLADRVDFDADTRNILETDATRVEAGKNVIYQIKDNANLVGRKGRIVAHVNSSPNYNPYDITLNITVANKDPQTGFKFDHDALKMPNGTTKKIAIGKKVDGSEVTYTSSAPEVATVKNDGTVEAVSEGTATIRAKGTATGDYLEAQATCTVTVIPTESKVNMLDPFANGEKRYKLELEEGISQLPSELSSEYPEISMIEAKLKEEVQKLDPTILPENIKIYDANLMVQRSQDDVTIKNNVSIAANTWKLVESEDDFPASGLPITIPYPEGTDGRRYNFKVVHMFTKGLSGTTAGEIETCGVTERDNGTQFTVKGLSPIAIGWAEDDSIRSDQTDFRFELGVVKMAYGEERNIGVLQTVPNSTITYTTSDDSVAMVDNTGRVEAVGEGEAIITATSTKTDDYRAAQASYRIIVVPEDTKIKTLNQFSSGNKKYRLQMEEGISQIPEAIENEYPEGEDIINKMRSELKKANDKITDENMVVYDITLLVQQEEGMGINTWEEVIEETDFPSKLAITLPYPEGTDKDGYDFAAVHMFTTEVNGKTPGEIEQPKITERSDGIRFTVTGLSPVAVGWIQTQADDPGNSGDPSNPGTSGDPSNPGTSGDPSNPNDPTNPSNPTNPTDPTNPSDQNNNNNQGNGNNQGNNNGTGNNNNNGTGTTGTGSTGTGTTGTGTTGTGSTTQTGTTATGAKTGDQNQILLYSILLAAAAAVIWIVCASRRKHR